MNMIVGSVLRHPIIAGTLATVIGGVILHFSLRDLNGPTEPVPTIPYPRSEPIELHDFGSAEVCGGRHVISVSFHAAIDRPPDTLTLRSGSLEGGQVINTGGTPAVLSPDCLIELVRFRYSGSGRYFAVVQEMEEQQ